MHYKNKWIFFFYNYMCFTNCSTEDLSLLLVIFFGWIGVQWLDNKSKNVEKVEWSLWTSKSEGEGVSMGPLLTFYRSGVSLNQRWVQTFV